MKKWNVWLPEKRICQVEASYFEIIGTRAVFFNRDRGYQDAVNFGVERFICADFPLVYGVIQEDNNTSK